MIAVAVINMSCALLVLIVEKTKMIGILKALGMKNFSLIKIFVSHGGILLFYGFLAGNSLALIIIHLQNKFEFLKLSQENYCCNNKLMSIIEPFCSISYLKSKNLRREVWTVKVTKNLSYTLQPHINFILRIYMEASVRRF